MTGDFSEISRRIRLTLPARWFNDITPVLDGLLAGLSAVWNLLFSFMQFVVAQSRILTASEAFLDMAARDFFGQSVQRRSGESDDLLRSRLIAAMQRRRATRAALSEAAAASGFSVKIFEAARPLDTGCYNVPIGLAWGAIGAWGSMQMPLECLIVAQAGSEAVPEELLDSMAAALPAGGVGWIHVSN